MNLKFQLISLFFSFIYGCVFYLLLDLFNRIINKRNIFLKYIMSFIFIIIVALIYFIGLLYINNGYLHVYFLFSIMVGYLFVYFLKDK